MIYQCISCGRLAVFRNASDRTVAQWYVPEAATVPPQLLSALDQR